MQSTNSSPQREGLIDYLWVVARGFAMGSADIVPGVSGGTMAFILGIYEELLDAISSINIGLIGKVLKFDIRGAMESFPWRFLLALALGIGVAILTLARGLSWALDNYPVLVWAFFFGLVVGAVMTIRRHVTRWTPMVVVVLIAAAVAAYFLVGMVPVETPDAPWFFFISGAFAICAMILPGISGAFILVLMGKYADVLNAVVELDILTLAIVGAGCAVGLLSFARLLRWLFKNHHDAMVAALTGLMIGSLRKVWPWKETVATMLDRHGEEVPMAQINILPAAFDGQVVVAIILAVAGFAVVVGLEYVATRGKGAQADQEAQQAV
jgi:putative membrane protein